ncbi:type I 3-dehydroquinate dehydratase, partial [Lactobacillus taiwanensis]|uniref:type I 3-dehydroquinate dehydratase n=1 Tax=Lactobacillus taiwanensis TaxID=508451 RepID=UPI000BDD67B0
HLGADIGKIAVMPHNERDVLRLMELTRRAGAFVSIPLITLLIGQLGMISRLLGNFPGSVMSFCVLTSVKASAPGPITVHDIISIIKLLNLNNLIFS